MSNVSCVYSFFVLLAGDTFSKRGFLFASELSAAKTTAETLVPQVIPDKIVDTRWIPRAVVIYKSGTSFDAVAATSSQGTSTTCSSTSATVECSGFTTPKAGYVPFFYITCGASSYLGSDPYHFTPGNGNWFNFPGMSNNNTEYIRSYECEGQDQSVRPTWKLIGWFDASTCLSGSGSGLSYDDNICVEQTTSMSAEPSLQPSSSPSFSGNPTEEPSLTPSKSVEPSTSPSLSPSKSIEPSLEPSLAPSKSADPSLQPSSNPSSEPSLSPSKSIEPSSEPSLTPSKSVEPSLQPSSSPSFSTNPTQSAEPSLSSSPSFRINPSTEPSSLPSLQPSSQPSSAPSSEPSSQSSGQPSSVPSSEPSSHPSSQPSDVPSVEPSGEPSINPTGLLGGKSVVTFTTTVTFTGGIDFSTLTDAVWSEFAALMESLIGAKVPVPEGSGSESEVLSRRVEVEGVTDQVAFDIMMSALCEPESACPESETRLTASATAISADIDDYVDGTAEESFTDDINSSLETNPIAGLVDEVERRLRTQSRNLNTVQGTVGESSPATGSTTYRSQAPSDSPSSQPSMIPSKSSEPSSQPSSEPSSFPSKSSQPSSEPSSTPSKSNQPSGQPSSEPSTGPSLVPSSSPSCSPSSAPTESPSKKADGVNLFYPEWVQGSVGCR